MIYQNDVQLYKAESQLEVPTGGGRMSALKVVSGRVNNLFPNISRVDRLTGRVQLRKVFLKIDSIDLDDYPATPAYQVGVTDLAGGVDTWTATPEDFIINVNGGGDVTVTLDTNCADLAAIISHINTQLSGAGISAVEAYDPDEATDVIGFRTVTAGADQSFILMVGEVNPNALLTLGLSAGTFNGTDENKDPAVYSGAHSIIKEIPFDTNVSLVLFKNTLCHLADPPRDEWSSLREDMRNYIENYFTKGIQAGNAELAYDADAGSAQLIYTLRDYTYQPYWHEYGGETRYFYLRSDLKFFLDAMVGDLIYLEDSVDPTVYEQVHIIKREVVKQIMDGADATHWWVKEYCIVTLAQPLQNSWFKRDSPDIPGGRGMLMTYKTAVNTAWRCFGAMELANDEEIGTANIEVTTYKAKICPTISLNMEIVDQYILQMPAIKNNVQVGYQTENESQLFSISGVRQYDVTKATLAGAGTSYTIILDSEPVPGSVKILYRRERGWRMLSDDGAGVLDSNYGTGSIEYDDRVIHMQLTDKPDTGSYIITTYSRLHNYNEREFISYIMTYRNKTTELVADETRTLNRTTAITLDLIAGNTGLARVVSAGEAAVNRVFWSLPQYQYYSYGIYSWYSRTIFPYPVEIYRNIGGTWTKILETDPDVVWPTGMTDRTGINSTPIVLTACVEGYSGTLIPTTGTFELLGTWVQGESLRYIYKQGSAQKTVYAGTTYYTDFLSTVTELVLANTVLLPHTCSIEVHFIDYDNGEAVKDAVLIDDENGNLVEYGTSYGITGTITDYGWDVKKWGGTPPARATVVFPGRAGVGSYCRFSYGKSLATHTTTIYNYGIYTEAVPNTETMTKYIIPNIIPLSVTITIDPDGLNHVWTDDGEGTLTGDNGEGTISYVDGVVFIEFTTPYESNMTGTVVCQYHPNDYLEHINVTLNLKLTDILAGSIRLDMLDDRGDRWTIKDNAIGGLQVATGPTSWETGVETSNIWTKNTKNLSSGYDGSLLVIPDGTTVSSIMFTSDGLTWTILSNAVTGLYGSSTVYAIAYSAKYTRWVITQSGNTGNSYPYIYISDGSLSTFTRIAEPAGSNTSEYPRSIIWSDRLDMFVAVGYRSNLALVWQSDDGSSGTWTRIAIGNDPLYAVCDGLDENDTPILVAGGGNSSVVHSYDGSNWILGVSPVATIRSLCFEPISKTFWAGSETGGLAVSDNGRTWEIVFTAWPIEGVTYSGTPKILTVVADGAGNVIVTCDGLSEWQVIMSSDRGISWSIIASDPKTGATGEHHSWLAVRGSQLIINAEAFTPTAQHSQIASITTGMPMVDGSTVIDVGDIDYETGVGHLTDGRYPASLTAMQVRYALTPYMPTTFCLHTDGGDPITVFSWSVRAISMIDDSIVTARDIAGTGVISGDATGTILYLHGTVYLTFNVPVYPESIQQSYNYQITYHPEYTDLNTRALPLDGYVPLCRDGDVIVIKDRDAEGALAETLLVDGEVIYLSSDGGLDPNDFPPDERIIQIENEKILVESRDGNVLTVATDGRGYDGTVAAEHAEGTTVTLITIHEDMLSVVDAAENIIKCSNSIIHKYYAGALVSSAVLAGDLQAYINGNYTRATWNGTDWETEEQYNGNPADGVYNFTDYPIELTNKGCETEQWALQVTQVPIDWEADPEDFLIKVIGRHNGQILENFQALLFDLEPLNYNTMTPFFKMAKEGWDHAWDVGEAVMMELVGADFPMWVCRTIDAKSSVVEDDRGIIELRGDVATLEE